MKLTDLFLRFPVAAALVCTGPFLACDSGDDSPADSGDDSEDEGSKQEDEGEAEAEDESGSDDSASVDDSADAETGSDGSSDDDMGNEEMAEDGDDEEGEAPDEGENLCDMTPRAKEPEACEPLEWVGGEMGDACSDDMRLCPTGSVAVGVRVNEGDFADQVTLICRSYDGESLGEETVATHLCGGFGGTAVDYRCDEDDQNGYVIGQRLWNSDALNAMGGAIRTAGAICQEIGGGEKYDVGSAPAMDPDNERRGECPEGKVVWGMDLNSGLWTDRVRFLCGSFE